MGVLLGSRGGGTGLGTTNARGSSVFGDWQDELKRNQVEANYQASRPVAPKQQPAPKPQKTNLFGKIVKVAKSVANAATTGEQKFAQGIARDLPGGTSDIAAQEKSATADQNAAKTYATLFKQGKISKQQYQKLSGANAKEAQQTGKEYAATEKSMPTKAQIGLGAASTAADIVTAGELPEVKALAGGSKLATAGRVGAQLVVNGAGGGLNAAAGGGSESDIVKNAIAGALLPQALHQAGEVVSKVTKRISDAKVARTTKAADELKSTPPNESVPVNKAENVAKVSDGEPVSGTPRASAYEPSAESRVTPEEAATKLAKAGYTPEETKTILSDALPEKGLSMPGSPKKIGLNDASVQQSAKNFDEAQGAKVAPQETAAVPPKSVATPIGAPEPAAIPSESSNLKPLQSIEDNPEQGTSKLGTSVREKAIQDKIISKTEAESDNLPTYNKANMKQQAEYATNLIKEDPQHAIDIALGKAEPPAHILPQMVYNAVEEHARSLGGEDGAKLLLDLSRSKQVSNLTTMAQNVRAAGERDPHSPVNAINQVKVAREEAAAKRGKSVAKEARKDVAAIRKATPKITKDDWTAFVDGLRC